MNVKMVPSDSAGAIVKCCSHKPNDPIISLKKPNLALPIGALLLALAENPAALAKIKIDTIKLNKMC
ncbi:unnamed protein product [Trifolium pratense]|uniref:Uncharacterized protein n=1 Tax=Trifolium pratense TaxID=57577 RepID=A0ACB0KFT5_TRIPR|nr:unnamed protein product [Trifolium pratense]